MMEQGLDNLRIEHRQVVDPPIKRVTFRTCGGSEVELDVSENGHFMEYVSCLDMNTYSQRDLTRLIELLTTIRNQMNDGWYDKSESEETV